MSSIGMYSGLWCRSRVQHGATRRAHVERASSSRNGCKRGRAAIRTPGRGRGACRTPNALVGQLRPDPPTDGLELADGEGAPLVSRFRSGGQKGGFNCRTVGFVDRRRFESLVQQDKQHHVPLLLKLDPTYALAWLRFMKNTAALDLKALCPKRCFPDRVVASLTNRRQLNV